MKNIMFVIRSLAGGGAERVILTLARKFSEDGVHPIIIIFEDQIAYEIPKNIELIILDSNSHSRLLRDVRWIARIRALIKHYNVSAIISFLPKPNLYSIIASFGLKPTLIISERNDPIRNASRVIDFIRKILYPFADKIVFQTDEARDYFGSINDKKCLCIPNPISNSLIPPYIGERRKEIINFCRFNEQKNLFLLIDSFADVHQIHPEFHLSIYGEGALDKELKLYVVEHSMENCCEIKSFASNIHDLIKDATCFVSSSDYEGISNSMLEAMAIGLPVICTDCPCGGARMVIRTYKNGILTKVGSKEELVKAILWIIDHPIEADKLGAEAQKIRDSLNENLIYERWRSLVV